MSSQIKVMAAKQAGKEAGKKAQAGASALGGFIRENNWSLRGISFLGSLAMIVLSTMHMINVFSVLTNFFDYVINLYSFLFAFAMLMIEAKDDWPLVEVCKASSLCMSNFHDRDHEYGFSATLVSCVPTWVVVSLRSL
jgi:hypothetical protein